MKGKHEQPVNDLAGIRRTSARASWCRVMTVHVINLDRDTERPRMFMDENKHVGDIARAPAVDGRTVDRAAPRSLGVIADDLEYSEGTLGCALSHIRLWHKAVKDDRAVTIAEDDGRFARNFAPAHETMPGNLPDDWGIILWGWNFNAPREMELIEGVTRSISRVDQNALRANIETFRNSEIAALPFRLHHAFGSMGYSVSPSGARVLLAACLPLAHIEIDFGEGRPKMLNRAFDSLLNAVYPRMKAYVCVQPLVVSENRQETSRTWRGT
jgi:GR25 family glycosyltransferase involved in LPS biosynthesis